MENETLELIDKAVAGDKKALQSVLTNVEDLIYNLSLRMLGSPHDAEDASQEIMIKIITQLSTFLSDYCGLSKTGSCNCRKIPRFFLRS